MLRTPLCERLGIEVPVIAAPFGPWEQVELAAAVSMLEGRGHEYLPFTGQSAALVHEILPAAEIVRRVVAEVEAVLHRLRFAGAA